MLKRASMMATAFFFGGVLMGSNALAADCVTNARGKVVCVGGGRAVVVNPQAGTATSVQKNGNGVTTAQSINGGKAAYNPHTGNAAASSQNSNGVTTTKTLRGGSAQTKNGKGVVQGPNGMTCAKGARQSGCKQL